MTSQPEPHDFFAERGSKIVAVHSDRYMKSYLILDSELKTISILNGAATLLFSAGSFCLSVGVGMAINLFVSDSPSAVAAKYGNAIERVAFYATAALYVLGIAMIVCKRSEIKQIKRESGDTGPTLFKRLKFWQ